MHFIMFLLSDFSAYSCKTPLQMLQASGGE